MKVKLTDDELELIFRALDHYIIVCNDAMGDTEKVDQVKFWVRQGDRVVDLGKKLTSLKEKHGG